MAAAAGFQGLTLALLLAAMLTGLLPWSSDKTPLGAADNPFADLHGWDTAGERARSLAAQHGLGSVSVQNWTLASRLGWFPKDLFGWKHLDDVLHVVIGAGLVLVGLVG